MNPNNINTEFTLPCGTVIKNRLVKAAMTERISNPNYEPTEGHELLYKQWAKTGAGILITGNVIFDKLHTESAGNVYFGDETMIPKLKKWADAGKTLGHHIWVQISHAGRQTNRFNNRHPLAPSHVKLKKTGLFGKPKVMTEDDIHQIIDGFVKAARITKKAGFTGLQIHSAHGYLLSQFLSPKTNTRKDQWGGSIENRSRLLLQIIRKVRKEVGDDFPISVKLNSSDFQKGGFSEDESLAVINMLNSESVDLLEISGGTYENVAFFMMNDEKTRESTKRREAYFMDFANKVRKLSQIPLMITGGFRSFDFCNEVLEKGELDFIGMGRPFITNQSQIPEFIEGRIPVLENMVIRTGFKSLDEAAEGGYYAIQIIRTSKGKGFKPKLNPLRCAAFLVSHEFRKSLSKKK